MIDEVGIFIMALMLWLYFFYLVDSTNIEKKLDKILKLLEEKKKEVTHVDS